MKKILLIALFSLPFSLLCQGASLAEEEPSSELISRVTRRLSVNRSMLARAQSDYVKLLKKERENPTYTGQKKLKGIEYKIKALSEDNQRLVSLLPQKKQAHEIMKDLLTQAVLQKPAKPAAPRPSIPVTAVLHERALMLAADRQFLEAARVYEEIILMEPDDDEAYTIMGHNYLLAGEYGKAETAFKNAVHIDPSNVEEIAPFYENIVIQNPDDDLAYANLGYAYLILGDFSKAAAAFHEALAINPQNINALNGMRIIDNN